MFAKYEGNCCYCGLPIVVGVDIYDPLTKRNWHVRCEIEQQKRFDRAAGEAIADRLGFIRFEDFSEAIFDNWRLRILSPRDRNGSAQSLRSDNASRRLFDPVSGMPEEEDIK